MFGLIKMSMTRRSFLAMASVLTLLCIVAPETAAASLAPDERRALMVIGRRLGHRRWNFSVDPCSGEQGWVLSRDKDSENAVNCSCIIGNDGVCHVTSIAIKAQNLVGPLPSELVQLPFLQTIDLTRNFINDSIPRNWSSMPSIKKIALGGNRLSGPIPRELFSISTLEELILEANRLSGSIPREIGNLGKLKKLVISSNNFTEELPKEIGDLKNLEDLRISDNFFRGKVPDFIQNLTALTRLEIVATGLEGPIPPGISNLTNLTILKINNLQGGESFFPPLSGMEKMEILILRNCNLSGEIPDIFGLMQNLRTLDLSFNKFSGGIPQSFKTLAWPQFVYLTGNMLSGDVPSELLSHVHYLDLSYNNYSWPEGCPQNERRTSINYFGSSSGGDDSFPCSRKTFVCKTTKYSVYINCGGKEDVEVGGITYEKDMDDFIGAAGYSLNKDNSWALSSTGNFLEDDEFKDNYTVASNAPLSMTNAELYKSARISPLSLTYYGFCLQNGSYNVTLHFAEIVFSNDNTYSSLGRRIFDVYVQGKLIWKDFNIKEEAKYGTGLEVLKNITVNVTDGSLEIRLYWNGQGTKIIPQRGVYGPLISAISVSPNFPIPSKKKNAAAILSGVLVPVFCILIVVGILWRKGILGGRSMENKDLRGLDLTGSFTFKQIKAATKNFHASNKIGEGGFGPVYKGILSEGTIIAVKQLSSKSKQGNREFVNEVGMISALQHPNLVKLYGCCIERNQLLLVYEYMENNSLFNALFGSEDIQLKLDWQTRKRVCLGIAKGLAYLHEESRLKIVHRDIKATNILLDKDLNPKISDFGLAKLDEEENSHISTRIAGTIGYMAPEYASRGYLTDKADVYSFGVVVLEVVSGKRSTHCIIKEALGSLQDWALVLLRKGSLLELVDPKLGTEFNEEEALTMIKVALLCIDVSFILRPSMSAVVSMLEGRCGVEEPIVGDQRSFNQTVSDPGISNGIDGEYNSRSPGHGGYDCSSHAQSKSLVVFSSQSYPLTGSMFPSTPDLFSISLDSEHRNQSM